MWERAWMTSTTTGNGECIYIRLYFSFWSKCKQELWECIPPPIWKFLALSNRKSMGQSGTLMIFCIQTMKWMKLKTERDLSYIDPLTVEFFQSNRMSSISIILLTNGRKEGQTDRQMVAILIPPWWR